MAQQPKEQCEIELGDGVRFRLTALDGVTARKLLARFGRVLGAGFVEQVVAEDMTSQLLGRVLLAMRSPDFEREQEAVFEILGNASEIHAGDGWLCLETKVQAVHFARRTKLMYEWLIAALKWQYADFFAVRPLASSGSSTGG